MTDIASVVRERVLLADQALFSDQAVWTMVNLRALWVALTQQRSDLRRLEAIGEQLRGVEPDVVRLAAELVWLMYLPTSPTCISQARKTSIVRTIYEWSGQTLAPSHPLLTEPRQPLPGGPGLFFSAHRADELLFLIKAVVGIKKHTNTEIRSLLSDPWETGRILDEAAGNEVPQLNHLIRHILFPDHFEAIFTRRDKRRIVEAFGGIPRKEARRWTVTQLDEELASIRKQMQAFQNDGDISFLREPLLSTWSHSGATGDVPASEQRFWVEKSSADSWPNRHAGPHSIGRALWLPRQTSEGNSAAAIMREVEPGDVIFHLTDNEGITGASVVEGEIEETSICLEGSHPAGESGYRIQLGDFTEVTPMLSQNLLLTGPGFQGALRWLADNHHSLFYNRQLTLNRDCYLTEAPEALVRIFNDAYRKESNRHLPHVTLPDHEDLPAAQEDLSSQHTRHPIAQILSGPTGAGKTCGAMARAVAICDGTSPDNHEAIIQRYSELQTEERIKLIAFHPSFEYAHFIERMEKAVVEGYDGEAPRLVDRVHPGVFRTMAELAEAATRVEDTHVDPRNSTIWKVTPLSEDRDDTYRDLLDGKIVACPVIDGIDFTGCVSRQSIVDLIAKKTAVKADDEVVSTIDQMTNQMSVGDLVILADNNSACRAIGRVTGDYQASATTGLGTYSQVRPVEWLYRPVEPLPWDRLARKAFLPRSLYRLETSLLNTDELIDLLEQKQTEQVNYVLIIDDIGKGNIAQIFGELATLIDMDKRTNGRNPLSVSLPLSGLNFSVPSNLYLIGTLDSADNVDPVNADLLRRRFHLDELSPDASLVGGDDQLGTIADGQGGRIDLRSLMTTVNQRIEYLARPEDRLGQGYFMQIRAYTDLLTVIRSRILPHLNAVFSGDWRKIQLVFGDVMSDGRCNDPQIICHEELSSAKVLGFDTDEEPSTRFWMKSERDLTPDSFRKVYSNR